MHCLHPKDLVVALFVIEHRRRKIVKHVVVIEWPISLESVDLVSNSNAKKMYGDNMTCIHSCHMKNL